MRQVVHVDSRRLAVESWGAPRGHPVFLLHGTPGSRVGPRPRSMILHQLGVRLIAYDRPGYGGSTRLEGRQVRHAAADVAAIADHLELESFAVVGRSGGGPHALACAALLPDRVTRAAALVSLAPWKADGLDWFADMTPSNVAAYRNAADVVHKPGSELMEKLKQDAKTKASSPGSLIPALSPEMPSADRRIVSDARFRRMLLRNYEGAISLGEQSGRMDGWLDDVLSFCQPWGFELASISLPVLLWHGEHDVFVPVGHFRWLADNIRHAKAVLEPSAAHFDALPVLPHVLRWLLGDTRAPANRPRRSTAPHTMATVRSDAGPVRG